MSNTRKQIKNGYLMNFKYPLYDIFNANLF